MSDEVAPRTDPTPGYERSDVGIRVLVLAGISLLVVIVLVGALVHGLFDLLASRRSALDHPPSPLAGPRRPPPGPRLRPDPAQELSDLRAYEEGLLKGYGWADRDSGRVRIPVAQAVEQIARRGLPVRREGVK